MQKARKGVVRLGRTYDQIPAPADDTLLDPSLDRAFEVQAYDTLGLQADPRPLTELRMDIADLIPKMPEPHQSIIRLMLEDEQLDTIAWRLNLHPAMASIKKTEAIQWLRERLSRS